MNQINKYSLFLSLVFNGGLLIYLFGAVPFFLFLSVIINASLLWYIKRFLDKQSDLEEDVIDVVEKVELFTGHIEQIHELEMFYGDENLQKLMEHSNELVNYFIDFQAKHFDVEVEEADEDDN
tara:strand:- start:995 stop:1363 length:369 start_codon:yes stop_codon:yes gene_type:complete